MNSGNEGVTPRPETTREVTSRRGDDSWLRSLRSNTGNAQRPLDGNTTSGSQAGPIDWARNFWRSIKGCDCFRGEDRTPDQVDHPPVPTQVDHSSVPENAFPAFDPSFLPPPPQGGGEVQIFITSADEGGPSTETQGGLRGRSASAKSEESVGKGSLLERKRARRASSVGSGAPLETSGDLQPHSSGKDTFLTPFQGDRTGGVPRGRSASVKSGESVLVGEDPLDDGLPKTADLARTFREIALKNYVETRTTPVVKELSHRQDCLEYRKGEINDQYKEQEDLLKENTDALTPYKIERDIIFNELDYRISEIKGRTGYIKSIASKDYQIREINSDDAPETAQLRRHSIRTAEKKFEDLIEKLNEYLYANQKRYLKKKKVLYKSKKEYIEQNPSKNTTIVISECDAVISECDTNLNAINQDQTISIDDDESTSPHNALKIINVEKLKEYLLSEVKEQKAAKLQGEENQRGLLLRLIEEANTRSSETTAPSSSTSEVKPEHKKEDITGDNEQKALETTKEAATTRERAFSEAVVPSDPTDNPYFDVAPQFSQKLWDIDSIPSNDILPIHMVEEIIGSRDSLRRILSNARMDDRVLHREEATSEES